MIDHPKTFLLKKIINYKTNNLESLGHLNAKHIDDLSEVLREYSELTAQEIITRIASGTWKVKIPK